MGTWDGVRVEIQEQKPDLGTNESPSDIVRRRKIRAVEKITGIPLVSYVVDFIDEEKAARVGLALQIDLDDKTGFSQATSDIPRGPLDVLIHSPGGSPTATESLVHQLRSNYDPIRVFIPHTAKSAATMFAFSGNELIVGRDSELGPIDPQLRFTQDGRVVSVPAQAALDQFDYAYQELSVDPKKVAVWLPILRQYGPSFMQECRNAIRLSEELVSKWLRSYMFKEDQDSEAKSAKVANWLADHNNFRSHSRRIGIEQLLEVEPSLGLSWLHDHDNDLESAVMDVYWAYSITFNDTSAFKIIEHAAGSAYIRSAKIVQVVGQQQGQVNPPNRSSQPPGRGQRRRDQFGRK